MWSTRDKVDMAFEKLNEMGYFAEQDFWCCQTCAWNDIDDEDLEKVVFYHNQDNDSWGGTDELVRGLYLSWSGDADEIIGVLNDCGLRTRWSGEVNSRIKILAEGEEK